MKQTVWLKNNVHRVKSTIQQYLGPMTFLSVNILIYTNIHTWSLHTANAGISAWRKNNTDIIIEVRTNL